MKKIKFNTMNYMSNIKPLEDGQIIIWLTPKEITSREGKQLSIIEGRLVLEGKEWDISCFENTSAKGTRYLKGKIKPPWVKPENIESAKEEQKF